MIYEHMPSTSVQRGDIAAEYHPVVGWPLVVFLTMGREKKHVGNMLEAFHQWDDHLGCV